MPRHSLRAPMFVGALFATLTSLPHAASAQGSVETRDTGLPNPRHAFEDSWFWGAKGGVTRFGTVLDGRVSAPVAGAEWFVTHSKAALLVSAEQSFFKRTSLVADPYAKDGARPVALHDARRYAAAALAAPVAFGPVRPYAGVGLALQVIREATPVGDFATQQQYAFVRDRVNDGQSTASAFIIGGAQAQWRMIALFVQGSVSGAQSRSLFNLGGGSQLEAGVRYNLASAFEK